MKIIRHRSPLSISVASERRSLFYEALVGFMQRSGTKIKSALIIDLLTTSYVGGVNAVVEKYRRAAPADGEGAPAVSAYYDKPAFAISIPPERAEEVDKALSQLKHDDPLKSTSTLIVDLVIEAWNALNGAPSDQLRENGFASEALHVPLKEQSVREDADEQVDASPWEDLPDTEKLWHVFWHPFYAGASDGNDLVSLAHSLNIYLDNHTSPSEDARAQIAECYQVVSVILRDRGLLSQAHSAINQSIFIARQLERDHPESVDILTTALYRRAALFHQLLEESTSADSRQAYLTQARDDLEIAADLAQRSRDRVRAVVYERLARIRAMAGADQHDIFNLLDEAEMVAQTSAGADESGFVLNLSGIFHGYAQCILFLLQHGRNDNPELISPERGRYYIQRALKELPECSGRWHADILVTDIKLLIAEDKVWQAISTAKNHLATIQQTSSFRIMGELKRSIDSIPRMEADQRHIIQQLSVR